jgi:pectinesterase
VTPCHKVFYLSVLTQKSQGFYKMAACVFTVSQDGSGDFQTVQEAIDAVPFGNTRRTVIRVSPGIYRQPVYIAKTKNFITLAGLCPEDTVLTCNNTATKIEHHQVCTFSSCFYYLL